MTADFRRAVDQALSAPVLVAGRLLPGAADLEIVVDRPGAAAVGEGLVRLGFGRRGDTWARLHSCSADVVTVRPPAPWAPPAREWERMLADAVPLPGCGRLRWLSTPDELLVHALRFAADPRPVPAGIRTRLHQALAAEPSAWVVAAERAVTWRAEAAVRLARDAYDGARPVDRRGRRALAAEVEPVAARPGGVVALSGLDGSGKSTQAHALAATLGKLGYDVSLEWTRLSFDRSLDVVAAPVKALLRRRRPADAGPAAATADSSGSSGHPLRARSAAVDRTWTAVVAAANGWTQRRTTAAALGAGRVVVRDRYVLDSVVQLHSVYGRDRDVSAQARLVEMLSPAPLAAFFLDVAPDVAYRRKPEEYTVEELAAHRRLYLREAERLDVIRVDAARPPAELAAELARSVWHLLS